MGKHERLPMCLVLVGLAASALAVFAAAPDAHSQGARPELVGFRSGALELKGFIWKPEGPGPFPAILWNHGSEKRPGTVDGVAPFFLARGYVFFVPHRRAPLAGSLH